MRQSSYLFFTLFCSFFILTNAQAGIWTLEIELDNQVLRDSQDRMKMSLFDNTLTLSSQKEFTNNLLFNFNTELGQKQLKESDSVTIDFVELGLSYFTRSSQLYTEFQTFLYARYFVDSTLRDELRSHYALSYYMESSTEISKQWGLESETTLSHYLHPDRPMSDDLLYDFTYALILISKIDDALSIKLPVESYFEWRRSRKGDGHLVTTISPTISYTPARNLELEFYFSMGVFEGHDGKLLANNIFGQGQLGVLMTYEAF